MEKFLFEALLSIALGALIGIEREKRSRGKFFAGVRTFTLASLFGYLTALLASYSENLVPIFIGLAGCCGLAISSYWMSYKKTKAIGMTTEMAFLVTFLIGILVFFDEYPYLLPISLSIITTLVLFLRESAHRFARKLTKKELRDGIIFAILAFIILPLLPKEPIDPYGILNLHLIWSSLVLLLGISFVAYVFLKLLGTSGLIIAGLLGGLVSSTSITFDMAQKIRERKSLLLPATTSTILACSTMFFRSLVIVSIFNLKVGINLVLPFLLLGSLGMLYGILKISRMKILKGRIDVESPLSLKAAAKFIAIFTTVLAISRIAKILFGLKAIYPISFIAGLPEVDAISISLATLRLDEEIAANGILLAAISNTIFKGFVFSVLAGKKAAKEIIKIFLPLISIGFFFFFL